MKNDLSCYDVHDTTDVAALKFDSNGRPRRLASDIIRGIQQELSTSVQRMMWKYANALESALRMQENLVTAQKQLEEDDETDVISLIREDRAWGIHMEQLEGVPAPAALDLMVLRADAEEEAKRAESGGSKTIQRGSPTSEEGSEMTGSVVEEGWDV